MGKPNNPEGSGLWLKLLTPFQGRKVILDDCRLFSRRRRHNIGGGSSMRLDRGTPSSKKLARGSTTKSTELDNDEQEMPSVELAKRGSPSSEERLTPMGMRIVVSLPEMTSPGDSSAEEVGLLPFV